MMNITKFFGSFCANRDVNLKVYRGEAHALLGENGAGKSTLMHILSGWYHHDQGEIKLEGKKVQIRSPLDALSYKIGMVHQHFKLVENLTVFENLILGRGKFLAYKQGFFKSLPSRIFSRSFRKKTEKRIQSIADSYGLEVDLSRFVYDLSLGERQRVEIVKVLSLDADILILDEPTAVLTPKEAISLFETLQKLQKSGLTIIFITHKLKEVLSYSDRVTIMRKGKVAGVHKTKDVDEEKLASLMVGEKFSALQAEPKAFEKDEKLLSIQDISCKGSKEKDSLKSLSLDVRVGEIVGVAGIAGNGQESLAECIMGLKRILRGEIYFQGKRIDRFSPRKIIEEKISYIPADRLEKGVAPNLSLKENLILKNYRSHRFLFPNRIYSGVEEQIKEFDVHYASLDLPAKHLSGGNLQKLILARELSSSPKLVVAVYPTRGLDIGATKFVQETFLKLKEEKKSVLYISEDLDDILKISDRVAVLQDGKIAGISDAKNTDKAQIAFMMTGGNPR